MTGSNRLAVLRGAAFSLLVATPAALANTWFSEQEPKPAGALNVTLLVMAIGFAIGGFVAAREAESDRARSAIAAGLTAFVPIQVIGIVNRIGRGDRLSIGSILVLAVVAGSAAALGGLLEARSTNRRDR